MNNNNNRNLQNDGNSNIRLVINENCTKYSVPNNIDSNKLSILSQGIKKAQNAIEKLVKIKRTSEKISINDNDIPSDSDFICYSYGDSALLNTEITADLYIIIKLEASSIKRFAKPSIIKCDDNGRPIIGTILYNTDYLQNLENDDLLEAISVIFLHEFTHILGFTKEILQKKFLILTRKVENRMNSETQTKLYVNGTTVIKKAKAYFNYPELDGVELEDANENNENMTHWSQRILLGDYMISEIYYSEQAISEITLALLEDLNWYTVNYYTGGLMKFGKHKGRDFFEKDCVEKKINSELELSSLLKSTFPNEFCSSYYTGAETTYGFCSSGRQSMSYCLNDELSTKLKSSIYERSYFAYGFSNKILIEYCPISYDYDAKRIDSSPLYYGGNCKYGEDGSYGSSLKFLGDKRYSSIHDILEDEYGNASFCVFSS